VHECPLNHSPALALNERLFIGSFQYQQISLHALRRQALLDILRGGAHLSLIRAGRHHCDRRRIDDVTGGDGVNWQSDARAYRETCGEKGVHVGSVETRIVEPQLRQRPHASVGFWRE
jgi:hypothetical protein